MGNKACCGKSTTTVEFRQKSLNKKQRKSAHKNPESNIYEHNQQSTPLYPNKTLDTSSAVPTPMHKLSEVSPD